MISPYSKACFTLIIAALLAFQGQAYSKSRILDDKTAIRAILTESRLDYKSMYAMACALRNRFRIRGDLKGVYGLRRDRVRFSKKNLATAQKAWEKSLSEKDVTCGAYCWLSDYDLKHSKPRLTRFRYRMLETVYIGRTHFYADRVKPE